MTADIKYVEPGDRITAEHGGFDHRSGKRRQVRGEVVSVGRKWIAARRFSTGSRFRVRAEQIVNIDRS